MNVQKEFLAAEGVNAPQVDFSFTRRGKLKQFRFVRLMFKKKFKEPIAKIQTMAYTFDYFIFLIKVGKKKNNLQRVKIENTA